MDKYADIKKNNEAHFIKRLINKRLLSIMCVFCGITSCVQVPKTTAFDSSLPYTEIAGYKFHTAVYGDSAKPVVIVVHGGPGGDFGYLSSLKALSAHYRVVFYDQRGTGYSPRENSNKVTLEQSLDDLNSMIQHYSPNTPVRLIGHSWGGMLVTGYLSSHPSNVSHAVIIEPGMLNTESATAFVSMYKESQSFTDIFSLIKYLAVYPFVTTLDGEERGDYVMTRLLNRNKPGGVYQCENQSMPDNVFSRAGYAVFNNMLKPVLDDPENFKYDLTDGIEKYHGELLMISSECSKFGFEFQKKYHIPHMPKQTVHLEAKNMGHNMVTLNPEWSVQAIGTAFSQ